MSRSKIGGSYRRCCRRCGYIQYKNPIPASAAIVTVENRIILVKRKFKPGKGRWALPSGFMESGETPEETCEREVSEETGLSVEPKKLIGLYRQPSKFYGDVLVAVFWAKIKGGRLRAGDDAQEAEIFHFDNLPVIPFDCNRRAIEDFLKIR
ncbi:NUDIX hydrolase [candidate division WOR-3 bacterium]|nr:NUDIX hydrolase [candidate division WOR-3 bacterium]